MNLLKTIVLTALIFFAICAVIILATLFIVTNLPIPNFLNLKLIIGLTTMCFVVMITGLVFKVKELI